MKATTSRGEIYIRFSHVHPVMFTSKIRHNSNTEGFVNQGDAGTYCSLCRDHFKGEVIAQGQSIIHPKDGHVFNKDKGRKIALAKAIQSFSLEDRRALWNTYLNR